MAEVARFSCKTEMVDSLSFVDDGLLVMTSKFSGGIKWSRGSDEVSGAERNVRLTGVGTGIGSVGRGRAGEDSAVLF